jgi:hypothetical protein
MGNHTRTSSFSVSGKSQRDRSAQHRSAASTPAQRPISAITKRLRLANRSTFCPLACARRGRSARRRRVTTSESIQRRIDLLTRMETLLARLGNKPQISRTLRVPGPVATAVTGRAAARGLQSGLPKIR